MEEVFERLSDMYSIEVRSVRPELAFVTFMRCAELGIYALQLQREHFHGSQPFEV
jgi:hypothetical protein